MERHSAHQRVTPAPSPEYRGEGAGRAAAIPAAYDRQILPLAWMVRSRLHSIAHFSSHHRTAAACVTYANRFDLRGGQIFASISHGTAIAWRDN